MVPEALRSKVDWGKPVRIIHNLMLPERRGIHTSSKTVPLHKCDLELYIKEGVARPTFCHLLKLPYSI